MEWFDTGNGRDMKPAIRVENLSKQYRIGTKARPGSHNLTESIVEGASALWRGLTNRTRGGDGADAFWALKDVSFEVQPGEVVGIIGRNGAGKSTLLKILSRIAEPTSGRAVVRGRMASLLEVGTGFHPELTGRENIYLNGSILGMSREEITRQFDAIVAFAEIEQFLDTPVKRYSSGMYVRLAFAVAAHLEPEILVVDEVLAVGDGQFQQKCLGKMQQFAMGGRTVLFVSHQVNAVSRLCSHAMLMDKGHLAAYGDKDDIINLYISKGPGQSMPDEWIDLAASERSGTGESRFIAARYRAAGNVGGGRPYPDGPLDVTIVIESSNCRRVSSLAVTVYDRFGTKLVNADTIAKGQFFILKSGRNEVTLRIESLHLNPGQYTLGLWLANYPIVYDHLQTALVIDVEDVGHNGFGRNPECDGSVTCSAVFSHGGAGGGVS
jgi:lipopolysaccharide transport system ATP-binding protein